MESSSEFIRLNKTFWIATDDQAKQHARIVEYCKTVVKWESRRKVDGNIVQFFLDSACARLDLMLGENTPGARELAELAADQEDVLASPTGIKQGRPARGGPESSNAPRINRAGMQ